jgi:predicted Zn-dependent protease
MMTRFFLLRPAAILLGVAMLILTPLRPAWALLDAITGALTIEKEKQIGEEFTLAMQQYVPMVEDPFLTSYINRLGQRLVTQLGPQPFKYRFFVIVDPSVNAFAVPGGYVFITTGMIRQMEKEGELAGVLAHEVSHVYARHMAKTVEKARITNVASLVGALAAVFLGGPLAAPLLTGTMAAGASAMLKYSRDFEQEADALGFKWMSQAGYNPRDMMAIFKKLSRQRWFDGGDIPIYLSTHPDIDSRQVEYAHLLAKNQDKIPPASPNRPEFQYFTIRLEAVVGNPVQLLKRMNQEAVREPKNPAFYYGQALALAKLERADEAIGAFKQALNLSPGNPLIQRDLAICYFQRNRYQDALQLLGDLSQRYPQDDVVLYYLGRIYQERKQIDQALSLFEKVHNLNPAISEVYYNLGTLYGEKGQIGLAHYYLGFHSLRSRALPTALFHFRKAMQNLPAADTHYAEVKSQVARLEKMRVRVPN